jgi:hypothetical protein
MTPDRTGPTTPAEWQEVVNLADLCLYLHAARSYGLAGDGPDVDVHRCQSLLRLGAELGYTPEPGVVLSIARELTGAPAECVA